MKMVLKVSPKQYSTKYIGYGDYEYRYVSTSVFLEKLKEIDYLSSKIVSIDSCTNAFRGQGGYVDKDSLKIMFKYRWKERKLFRKWITLFLLRDNTTKYYGVEMK